MQDFDLSAPSPTILGMPDSVFWLAVLIIGFAVGWASYAPKANMSYGRGIVTGLIAAPVFLIIVAALAASWLIGLSLAVLVACLVVRSGATVP